MQYGHCFYRLFPTFLFVFGCFCASALEWTTYQNVPNPAPGAFGVAGTALPDGRLILWNGDQIFIQHTLDADAFSLIASGYTGDPSFIATSPDGHTLLLGAGAGDFFNPPDWKDSLYHFDLKTPVDHSPEAVVLVQPHFDGVFLNETLALLDVGKPDFSGSELVIVDVGGGVKSLSTVVRKAEKYDLPKDLVVDKPGGSFSAKLAVDQENGIVYAMDANTLELRFFDLSALIAAFQNSQTLDWETDGTLVGEAGMFFSNGVNGITPEGHLIISGSLGFLQPGGIQIVDPNLDDSALATILSTEDPAGNQPFYAAIYSSGADTITAFDFGNWYASIRNLNNGQFHSADTDQSGAVSLSQLLRVVQLYNVGGFSCAPEGVTTEDGFMAAAIGARDCASHNADNNPRDWRVDLSELLRVVQLYNALGYAACPTQLTEDGFCPAE